MNKFTINKFTINKLTNPFKFFKFRAKKKDCENILKWLDKNFFAFYSSFCMGIIKIYFSKILKPKKVYVNHLSTIV